MKPSIVDLSHALDPNTPVFADYPPVEIEVLESTGPPQPDGRRSLNSSRIAVGMHCGTHMDAPFHFFEDRCRIDRIPLDRFVGPSVLADVELSGGRGRIEPEHLTHLRDALQRTRKVVIKTGWYKRWGDPGYFTDFPVVSGSAAEFLVECGVHLFGIDTPSVDDPPFPAHLVLLGNDVVIVENLTNLDAVDGDLFQLVVLPLKITDREASPARAIAMPVNSRAEIT